MKVLVPITSLVAAVLLLAASAVQSAPVAVATYKFNNSFAAEQAGAPALISINPLGTNGFESAVVDGSLQQVFHWRGAGDSPLTHAGLQLDATGLVTYDNYSIDMTFEFLADAAFGGGWRRIVDTQNRQSDNGFYVDPDNFLQVYPVATGSTIFTTPGFHHVVLSNFVNGNVREVKAYLDGVLQLVSDTDQLNLDNANNPGHLLHFFVDNLAGPAQQEYADGRIAALTIYDGILVGNVPEPTTWALMLGGLVAVSSLAARRKARAR